MTNASTYIRLLRHLGIALVFAPEPLTTPFGVACILAARHLSKRHEASVNERVREAVRYYLAHTGGFGDHAGGIPGARAAAKRRNLSKEPAILGQITGCLSFEPDRSAQRGRRDARGAMAGHTTDVQGLSPRYRYVHIPSDRSSTTRDLIRHKINAEWLSRRRESADNTVAHSSLAITCRAVEEMTRHSINTSLPSQHGTTGNFGQMKTKCHTVDRALLRERRGSTVSHTTVVRALQNNNHYYDTLSRGNVIGP